MILEVTALELKHNQANVTVDRQFNTTSGRIGKGRPTLRAHPCHSVRLEVSLQKDTGSALARIGSDSYKAQQKAPGCAQPRGSSVPAEAGSSAGS